MGSPVADAVDLARVRRVLVLKLRHHGDVLLTSPVFSVLKAQAPWLEIDALIYDDTQEMLSLHPAVSAIHTVGRRWRERPGLARLGPELTLLGRLRARRYDLLIHLTDHPRGAWLARLLKPQASVAPRRPGRWWRSSFTHLYPTVGGGRRHTVETHLDALRRIGIVPAADARRLVLVPGAEALAAVDALLGRHGLRAGAFVHLHPASRWRFKCWPAEATAGLIDRLQADGLPVVLSAAPAAAETALIDAIVAQTRTAPVNLAGQLTLKELAALSARARLFIGVDSAPMHIAAAMGTPSVALFGPSGEVEWGPWQVAHRVVSSAAHPCRPCGFDGCGGGKLSECLSSIPVGRVHDAARELLTRGPADAPQAHA